MQSDQDVPITLQNIDRVVSENRDQLRQLAEIVSAQRDWRIRMEEKWNSVATREDVKDAKVSLAELDAKFGRRVMNNMNNMRWWFAGIGALIALSELLAARFSATVPIP